jgi:hypothetical protein
LAVVRIIKCNPSPIKWRQDLCQLSCLKQMKCLWFFWKCEENH